MASNPQQRRLSRPSSRASSTTRYELDVDAFLGEKDDDDTDMDAVVVRNDPVDRVLSEEIEGPTDFTMNMEYWMRGGQWPKNKKIEEKEVQTIQTGQDGTVHQNWQSKNEKVGIVENATAKFESRHISRDVDLPSPSKSEPEMSTFDGLPKMNDNGSPVISDSEEDSAPIARPKSSLQPSVEDYNSTPIRPKTTRSASSSALGDTLRKSIARRYKEAQAQQLPTSRDATIGLQRTIDSLRHELLKCKAEASAECSGLLSDFERRREDYQRDFDSRAKEKDSTIKRLNQELSTQRPEANELRSHKGSLQSELQNQRMKNIGLRQTLNYQVSSAKRKAEALRQSMQQQIEELRKQHEEDIRQQRTSYEAQISSLQAHLAAQSSQQNTTLFTTHLQASHDNLSSQLKALQSQLTAANTTIDSLRTELTQFHGTIHALRQQVESSDQNKQMPNLQGQQSQIDPDTEISRLQSEIADLTTHLRIAELERDLAQSAHEDAEERIAELERKFTALERSAGANHQLRRRAAVLESESAALAERVEELEDQVLECEERINDVERERDEVLEEKERTKEMCGKLEDAVRRMKGERGKEVGKGVNEAKAMFEKVRVEMESRFEMKFAALEEGRMKVVGELRTSREDAKTAVKERDQLRARVGELEAVIKGKEIEVNEMDVERLRAEFDQVNKLMDKRVKEMMNHRDQEWINRIELLDKDRKIMGKILLREWGKDELGKSEPQAYRYKYAVQ